MMEYKQLNLQKVCSVAKASLVKAAKVEEVDKSCRAQWHDLH